MKRRLTTILIADIAGYSRLMGADEEGTHRRVVALSRELLEPAVGAYGGTVVKRTGDGLIAEFPSVVEAVRCAVEMQQEIAARNSDHAPEPNIAFRIGINLGDVIDDTDDIYGDGVNIAARLEALAEPGGIVVSRSVRDQVRDRLPLSFEDLGQQIVKNIARPVRAFHIRPGTGRSGGSGSNAARRRLRRALLPSLSALAIALAVGAGWWLGGPESLPAVGMAISGGPSLAQAERAGSRLSIVVLPFANLGGNPQQDYFVDGITQSLTTDLTRALPGSFVVARGTAFSYKDKAVDAGEIGRDLNVRYLLQGSVIPDGDRVRINAQLIDTESNTQLWAERFDKERKDVLEIQDQIVGRLSRSVGLELVDIEARRSERERPGNPTAIDFVMRGQAIANRPASRQTMIAARTQFQRALDNDPDNVDALAGLGTTYVFEVLNSYYEDGREERLRQAKALVRRALALEPRHIVALKARAALFRAQGEFDDAIAGSQGVIALKAVSRPLRGSHGVVREGPPDRPPRSEPVDLARGDGAGAVLPRPRRGSDPIAQDVGRCQSLRRAGLRPARRDLRAIRTEGGRWLGLDELPAAAAADDDQTLLCGLARAAAGNEPGLSAAARTVPGRAAPCRDGGGIAASARSGR